MDNGLDVSFWNGTEIDWNKIAAAGYTFVYIKAGEGLSRIEPNAQSQASGAKAAGLKIGFYYFAHPGESEPIAEADFFNSILSNLPPADLLPVLDLEVNKMNLTIEQMTQWINDFYNEMLKSGKETVLYTYTSFYNSFIVGKELLPKKLWLASYTEQPILPIGRADYQMWQYTQHGQIDGMPVNCDLNKCDDLNLLLSPSA
jgi:lysozyme